MVRSDAKRAVPVIDLFAGPGGLGEGFSAASDASRPLFQLALSVEKDAFAHRTLKLRAFYRQLLEHGKVDEYLKVLRGGGNPEVLFDRPEFREMRIRAESEAICAELGRPEHDVALDRKIAELRADGGPWVLVGGPPCQAYSLVGRARNRGNAGYSAEKDPRTTLYRQYLRILGDHRPAAFVMENVKGLLSAKLGSMSVFEQICRDLQEPPGRGSDPGYELYSLVVERNDSRSPSPADFIVRSEEYGVPQARHRVIILGVRRDIRRRPALLKVDQAARPPHVGMVIGDLPRLRSRLSDEPDSREAWREALSAFPASEIARLAKARPEVAKRISCSIQRIRRCSLDVHAKAPAGATAPRYRRGWYDPHGLGVACNHEARGHMRSDLHRYLFCSAFALEEEQSPKLKDFPRRLLPAHRNVEESAVDAIFADRFRVQMRSRVASTITSHIGKDGHYFIHPDPVQCRSLTVREAARLQTFPDDYFFCGPRTSQYTQVGNAVPPLLAEQIARIVHDVVSDGPGEG